MPYFFFTIGIGDANGRDFDIFPGYCLEVGSFLDSTSNLSFHQILGKEFGPSTTINLVQDPILAASFTCWFKVRIMCRSEQELSEIFVGIGKFDRTQLYLNGECVAIGGLSQKGISSYYTSGPNFFKLDVEVGDTLDIYIRGENTFRAKSDASLEVLEHSAYLNIVFEAENGIRGFGIFCLVAWSISSSAIFYAILQYLLLGSRVGSYKSVFLYFALYLVVLNLHFIKLVEFNTDYVILFSNVPLSLREYLDSVLSLLTIIVNLLFVRSFSRPIVPSKRNHKQINHLVLALIGNLVVEIAVIFFAKDPVRPGVSIYLIRLLVYAFIGVFIWRIFKQKKIVGSLLAMGLGVLIVGTILYKIQMVRPGEIYSNLYNSPLAFSMVSTVIQILLFFAALSIRNRLILEDNKQKEGMIKQIDATLAKIELKALKSGFATHFHKNALAIIDGFIQEGSISLAQNAVRFYAQFLQEVLLFSNRDLVYLEDELQFVNTYLNLVKCLHNESLRISYQENVQADLRDELLIPSMLIQPLIENAVKKAIFREGVETKLVLNICEDKAKAVLIDVEDSGDYTPSLKIAFFTAFSING
ncbi:MAG: histidine kinase [Bacteroidota bacterium]